MDKKLLLQQIVFGQHPNPIEALVDMINKKQITREYAMYELPLPPKLRMELIDSLPSRGGTRRGAGRPKTGRKRKWYFVTDEEHEAIKKYIEELRNNWIKLLTLW